MTYLALSGDLVIVSGHRRPEIPICAASGLGFARVSTSASLAFLVWQSRGAVLYRARSTFARGPQDFEQCPFRSRA